MSRKELIMNAIKKWLKRKQLKPGTQILSVPDHAKGNIYHRDVQAGFVFRKTRHGAFCRYWRYIRPNVRVPGAPELRNKANSELTPFDNLIIKDSVNQSFVEKAIRNFCIIQPIS